MTGGDPGSPPTRNIVGYEPFYIYPGQQLVRVFRTSAIHRSLSYNPTIPDPPDHGGRFDRTCPEDSTYLYAATPNIDRLPVGADMSSMEAAKRDATYTAIIETLRPSFSSGNNLTNLIIPKGELHCRSLQYFEVREELLLASLTDPAALTKVNGNEDICISGDRQATQAWSSYWQKQLPPNVVGLAYNSTPSTIGRGTSIVLWGDRIGSDAIFKPASQEFGLFEYPFSRTISGILTSYGVTPV